MIHIINKCDHESAAVFLMKRINSFNKERVFNHAFNSDVIDIKLYEAVTRGNGNIDFGNEITETTIPNLMDHETTEIILEFKEPDKRYFENGVSYFLAEVDNDFLNDAFNEQKRDILLVTIEDAIMLSIMWYYQDISTTMTKFMYH